MLVRDHSPSQMLGIPVGPHAAALHCYQVSLHVHESSSEPLRHQGIENGVENGVEVVTHSLERCVSKKTCRYKMYLRS